MKVRLTLLFITGLLHTGLFAQSWNTYPYHQNGSVLTFPNDEGYHPGEVVEWWYTNAHIKGDSTGTDYSYMLTYFYYPTFGFDGFRILNISNEQTGEFLAETLPCQYLTLAQDHLHIVSNTGITGGYHEEWKTEEDSVNNLIPFHYHVKANSANGAIDVTYTSVRRPLMVGGTGFLYEGITGYTYYYSETELQVSGTITMNGVTEGVHGIAWIDRQWGQFNPNNGEKYTWFSLQLSNGMGLNLWNIFNTANQIPDTSTYRFCSIYLDDSTSTTVTNFNLERLKYVFTPDNQKCYDQQWRLTYGNVDLTLTATHSNNEVSLPFRFFEGSVNITGTVGGTPVTGVGYVELLHSFSHPQVVLSSPVGHVGWDGTTPVSWHLNNPDDGRPVYYDLEVSTDNKATYTTLAQHLTDTFYNWSPSLPLGTEGWFRVTAYSIDTTLHGNVVSDASFIYGTTGIEEQHAAMQVAVAPNPFTGNAVFAYELPASADVRLDILDAQGNLVSKINKGLQAAGKHQLELTGDGLAAGLYYYRLHYGDKTVAGSLVKQQ